MAQKLTFQYDREADILYINTVAPYAAQESEELGDEIIVFTSRLLRRELFSLPVIAELRQAEPA